MKNYHFIIAIVCLNILTFKTYSQSEYRYYNGKAHERNKNMVISPNDYKKGSVIDRIESAINDALRLGVNSIEIPRVDVVEGKTEWLIERAIVLPSDFTLILKDCLIRLAPGTKDNIITNSGARTQPLTGNKNIKIVGQGNVVLSGGMESHFDPPGDRSGYKTIGILLYNTEHFIIEGIKIEESQTYAISVENGCAYGRISNIELYSTNKYPNQDGIDVLKGCHDIIIENITGISGDDMIALTGLRRSPNLKSYGMEIVGSRITDNDDIYNIIINNIQGTTAGGHHIIRLLNHDGVKIYNIFISNVMDTSKEGDIQNKAAVLIGDGAYYSISKNQLGETSRIFVNNVLSRSKSVIKIRGTLKDAVIRNIVGYGENTIVVDYGNAPIENVKVIDSFLF
ncbi:MAG: hypothetical protein GYA36_17780 [Veillonellaceae bacterium]|nr:hypothetical protein [Veillonellaceae bacterium]